MDINLLTIIAIIGGLFLIPALLVGRAIPQLGGHWPRRWRLGLAGAGAILCLTGLAGGWLTLRAEYRSVLAEADVSTLRLPSADAALHLDDPQRADFLVTLIVRDRMRGDDPVLLDQARISLQSAVRGNLKTVTRGDREYLWRLMINPPRLTDHPLLDSAQAVWTVVGSAGFVPRGQDPVRGGGPFGFSLAEDSPIGQITLDLPRRTPAFGFLVPGERSLAATMVFEPLAAGADLQESSPEAVMARYGVVVPALEYAAPKPDQETAAARLAKYLNVAGVPFGAGVLLLALGFARHRVLALAAVCAIVIWGIALAERAALGHHLRKAGEEEAPLAVRVAAIQHADASFFWGRHAEEGLRTIQEKREGLPEELRRILDARAPVQKPGPGDET